MIFATLNPKSGIFPCFSSIPALVSSTTGYYVYQEHRFRRLTGYALDPMQERWSALRSGILLGAIWVGYHIPIFIINGYSFEWIFWHGVYTIAGRVLFVWIYNNAGKSLFSMALTHSTFGLFWSMWPSPNMHIATPYYVPRIGAITAITYVVIVALLWGPKTLAAYRFARSEGRILGNGPAGSRTTTSARTYSPEQGERL